ncbi:MAG: hypothetical protein C5B55_02350 [Blastocatellia bacterium]|nr:MAG: hypothetical protein C5B55_02350 [Blastocatellia bacterium]
MSKARLAALSTLTAVIILWAASFLGAARKTFLPAVNASSGLTVQFKNSRDHGLLVDMWIDQAGPFVFAIDTGAGSSIISRRVVDVEHLVVRPGRRTLVGGLSTSSISSNQETTLQRVAIGRPGAMLTATVPAAVADSLPAGIDGILDPLDVSPYGYSVDLPNRTLTIFESTQRGLSQADVIAGGAVVRWVRGDGSSRPFVKLGDGRLALIDTGSNFGLAVSDGVIVGNHGRNGRSVHDLGGGSVQSTRVAPTIVSIGALVLRSVPTDVLSGVAANTPVIIGRDALYPFRITFDPLRHLIAIEPAN